VKKSDLALLLIDHYGLAKKDANAAIELIFEEIARSLSKGEPVQVAGFGTFKKKVVPARKARMGRNPFTGEQVMFAAKKASSKPVFSSAKVLKDIVSGATKLPAAKKPAAKPAAKPVAKKAAAKKTVAKKTVKKAAKKVASKKKPARKR
jgi:DNA-binding protein HU-beta